MLQRMRVQQEGSIFEKVRISCQYEGINEHVRIYNVSRNDKYKMEE